VIVHHLVDVCPRHAQQLGYLASVDPLLARQSRREEGRRGDRRCLLLFKHGVTRQPARRRRTRTPTPFATPRLPARRAQPRGESPPRPGVTKAARLLYPLVRQRAAEGFLVTVTCPVLTLSPQGYLKFIDLGVGRTTLRHRSRRPYLASRCSVGPLAHPPALVRCDFHIPSRLPCCTSYTLPCDTLVSPFSLGCCIDLISELQPTS
jgi:hypothetical protein